MRKGKVRLEHEQQECVLYAPGPGTTWCGCLFLVEVETKEGPRVVAASRDPESFEAAARLLGIEWRQKNPAPSSTGAW